MNPKVDDYFTKVKRWHNELVKLRQICNDCGLTEEFKWRNPCYTFQNKNILFIGELKDSCVLSFIKGSLLNDSNKVLIQQTINSQAVRIVRFTSVNELIDLESILKAYIFEAIEIEKAGLKVDYKKDAEILFPKAILDFLSTDKELKNAIETLTPGRKRGYNIFFSAAKQPNSQVNRILKYRKHILEGKGMNDCICGLSKKMPNCDGSHKFLSITTQL